MKSVILHRQDKYLKFNVVNYLNVRCREQQASPCVAKMQQQAALQSHIAKRYNDATPSLWVEQSNLSLFNIHSLGHTTFFIFLVSLGGVRLSPLGTLATVGLLYQPWMINDDWAVGGMRIGRENRITRKKPAPVPLCPPQIPYDQTWDRTRAAAVGSQRLTAWAMTQPRIYNLHLTFCCVNHYR
jgi:hypothetical protein